MATAVRVVRLPVGPRPGWELEDDEMNAENGEWHNVADSLVILQSLKQSRERWLTSVFPKFSGRARGNKQPEVKPPPHSVKAHQKFEFSVGPHTFSNTRLYEIHYLQQQPGPLPIASSEPATGPSVQTSNNSTGASDINSTPTRFSDFVTPALLEQVTQAASTDPNLHHLLKLAQKNQLSEEQRSTLAAFVRSLNEQLGPHHLGSDVSPSGVLSNDAASMTPVRPFDLVIEFQERPSDRWLVPRGKVHLADAYASNLGSNYDVAITIDLPVITSTSMVSEDGLMAGTNASRKPKQTVKLHWKGLQQDGYDILLAWSCSDSVPDTSKKLEDISAPSKIYLAHRLPDGELIEMLRVACTPHLMKSIKPSNADVNRSRRKSTRKVTIENASPAAAPVTYTSTLSFPTQPPSIPPPLQIYAPPTPAVLPPLVVAPPPNPPFNPTESVAPQSPAPFNPPMVLPLQPVNYPPPPIQQPQTVPAPQEYVSPSVQHRPVSPAPSHSEPAAGPSAPVAQYNGRFGGVVSFAPISTPAIEALSAEATSKSVKRRKVNKVVSTPSPPPIRCRACNMTDIPLLMGGRICRPCLDGGRLSEAIPDFDKPRTEQNLKSSSGSTSASPPPAR